MKFLTDFPLINAVLSGNQEGNIFELSGSDAVFVQHKSSFSWLQATEVTDIKQVLNFFIQEKKLLPYFHIYDAPVNLTEAIKADERFGIKLRKRIQLSYLKDTVDNSMNLPTGFSAVDINESNFDQLDVFGLNLAGKFWKSKEYFLKHGYGVVIKSAAGKLACVCYTCCIADAVAEIDIATLPEFQGKGLAKYATLKFIEKSITKGIKANWDCFEDNTGSLKTAKSNGFVMAKEYVFLSLYFNNQ